MKPWKSVGDPSDPPASFQLQWGHGDEAVEERADLRGVCRANVALQWGHGDEAVEEVLRECVRRVHEQGFNGATAMKPWKRRARNPEGQDPGRFNGATAMKPWKSWSRRVGGERDLVASMGPRR